MQPNDNIITTIIVAIATAPTTSSPAVRDDDIDTDPVDMGRRNGQGMYHTSSLAASPSALRFLAVDANDRITVK